MREKRECYACGEPYDEERREPTCDCHEADDYYADPAAYPDLEFDEDDEVEDELANEMEDVGEEDL